MRLGLIATGLIALCGCGNAITDGLSVRPLVVTDCDTDGQPEPATDMVILDWNGGAVALYPDEDFPAIDFGTFRTADGGTLAEVADEFMERVRRQVTHIYCETPDLLIRVENDAGQSRRAATVIHVSQSVSPTGSARIGEAEYDVCNRFHDNVGIIFGEQMRRLGTDYTVDEWVHMFANTIAHEIGHTLGFGHIPRDQAPEASRLLFVEIMLVSHTLEELVRENRFVVDQSSCPSTAAYSRHLANPVLSCGRY